MIAVIRIPKRCAMWHNVSMPPEKILPNGDKSSRDFLDRTSTSWEITFRIITTVAGLSMPVIVTLLMGIYSRIGALEIGQAEIRMQLHQPQKNADEISRLTNAVHQLELQVERMNRSTQ